MDFVKKLDCWLTTEQRVNYFLCVTMYNSTHGLAPAQLCNSVVMACETSDRDTWLSESLQVCVPEARTNDFKKSFLFRAKVWNALPPQLHNATSSDNFKSQYEQYVQGNAATT